MTEKVISKRKDNVNNKKITHKNECKMIILQSKTKMI